jgi:hypothetical protein
LDSHGEQHIRIDGTDNAHLLHRLGRQDLAESSDVSLNLPEDKMDEEFIQAAIDEWLNQAQEVVCGCAGQENGSGDSWYMYEIPFRVRARQTHRRLPWRSWKRRRNS